MRAIIVSVDYTDLLAITLPWNRHHFGEVMLVTDRQDVENVEPLAAEHECRLFTTDSFYARGATFNKWAALEEALDAYGRKGWLCLMDADVLWPKDVSIARHLQVGTLIAPLRHMMEDLTPLRRHGAAGIPDEKDWGRFPIHRNIHEWAGYSQIFHAEDPHLPPPPWHETDWRHAGGADSFFQMMWPPQHKVRPDWRVLHLGPAGANWYGRSTAYLSGASHPQAGQRQAAVENLWLNRRGKQGMDRFKQEKL
jgi:hypothetical protein